MALFTEVETRSTRDNTVRSLQKDKPLQMKRVTLLKDKSVCEKDFDPEESRYEKNLEEFGNNVDSVLSEEGIDKTFEDRGLTKSDGLIKEQPDIKDYEFKSYGKIKTF